MCKRGFSCGKENDWFCLNCSDEDGIAQMMNRTLSLSRLIMFLDEAKAKKKKKESFHEIFFYEIALCEFFFVLGRGIDNLLDFNNVSVSLMTSDENVASPAPHVPFSVDSSK